MKLSLRHFFVAALILYWPVAFLLTHVSQVPMFILRTQMSDKTMHYLGYLLLVFLWWFSVYPAKRPSLFSSPLWISIFVMMAYGVIDEWLQGFVHRTPDIRDWAADMSGVLTGLIIFGIVGLPLSALGVATVAIVVLTSVCKTDPLGFVPFLDIVFYVGAYGFVTVLWMNYLSKRQVCGTAAPGCIFRLLLSLLFPAVLLIATALIAARVGKEFESARLIASIAGIVIFFVFYLVFLIYTRNRRLAADDRQPIISST